MYTKILVRTSYMIFAGFLFFGTAQAADQTGSTGSHEDNVRKRASPKEFIHKWTSG